MNQEPLYAFVNNVKRTKPEYDSHRKRVFERDELYLENFDINCSDNKEFPNIFLFVVDALNPKYMSAYGYAVLTTPFIDNLI